MIGVDPKTSARMARVRSRDTTPELALRKELHRRGRRYFVHRRLLGDRRTVDLAFPGPKVAVFIDGCFWHSCPDHGTSSHTNADWWLRKLAANVARDRRTDEELEAAGWRVVRVWEHEGVTAAADRVEEALPHRTMPAGSAKDIVLPDRGDRST